MRDSAELPLDDEGRHLVGLDPGLGVDDRGLSKHGEHLKSTIEGLFYEAQRFVYLFEMNKRCEIGHQVC